jgi:hypothetical protein
LLEDRLTGNPVAGAGPFSVTVPVDGVPPITEVGMSPRLTRLGALMVRVPV